MIKMHENTIVLKNIKIIDNYKFRKEIEKLVNTLEFDLNLSITIREKEEKEEELPK